MTQLVSLGVHAGQGDLQIHPGAFQPSPNTRCFRLPLYGPALKINVLAEGPSGSSSGCYDPVLGPCVIPISSCPSSSQSDQEDQGPENQGNLGVPSVAFCPLVGSGDGDDGRAPMLLPHFRTILKTQDNSPVSPYLDPLVALHLSAVILLK